MKYRALLGAAALLIAASDARAQQTPPIPPPLPADVPPPPPVVGPSPTAPDLAEPVPPPVEAPVAADSVDPALLAADPGAGAAELSEEELKALGFDSGEGTSTSVDTSLKFFGFADFGFSVVPAKKSNTWRNSTGRHTSFAVGNVNLFFSKAFTDNVRTLGEVRFLFAPHGSQNPATGTYVANSATDPADFDRRLNWGGVELERLYFEWQLHSNLALRTGIWLTPYGIWNVDHGTPLFIPVNRPYVIGSQLFPERQTGFEFFGSKGISDNGTIGYHLTLSNGIGPVAEVKDLDDNKAVGGRLYWDYRRLGQFRLGGSVFYGKDTSAVATRGLDSQGRLALGETVTQQSKVLSLAADAQWKYKGWHLQAEVITKQKKFTDAGRVGAVNQLTGGVLAPIDDLSWGVYGIIGYRFDWLGVMPFVMPSSFKQLSDGIKLKTNGLCVGINAQPMDGVVLKLDYIEAFWPEGFIISDKNLRMIETQLAWAF